MAKLTAKQLKALPDSMFGLPKTRQYPMPDKTHVIKAIQFFKYCPDKDKPELARNINRRAKELKMQIKVQPSSAFYKYADKSILKEATMVQEFHIGQLSPIVTLQPTVLKPTFGSGSREDSEGPMERLRKLWASKKSMAEKEMRTATIIENAVFNGYSADANMIATLEGISDLSYMYRSYIHANVLPYSTGRQDTESELYSALQVALKDHRLDDVVKIVRGFGETPVYAKALALISYTTDISNNEREYILAGIHGEPKGQDIPIMHKEEPDTSFTDRTMIPSIIGMNDEDVYHIDQFVNLISGNDQNTTNINNFMYKLACKKFGTDFGYMSGSHSAEYLASQPYNIIYTELMKTGDLGITGYYRKIFGTDGWYDFYKIGSKIYCMITVYPNNTPKKQCIIFMVVIYDYDDQQYNTDIIACATGYTDQFATKSIVPMKIKTRCITLTNKRWTLEATDFKALYNGIQINKNGNVSFMLDELQPWGDKYSLCKSMMERNLKDKEYAQYKNNLCALYSLINVIYNRYNPTFADDSQEAKQALSTMDKCMTLFKDGIGSMSKIQPEFNFVDYYMSSHYNDKLSVFKSLDDKELRDEATIAYGWIMK